MAQAAQTQVQKAARKSASKGTQAPASATQAPALTHVIKNGFRPSAGAALYAHTQAFLELSGMAEGKAVPRATVSKAIGDTATKYHVAQCNMEATPEGLTLTERGQVLFSTRSINPEMLKAFKGILTTGKADGTLIKNQSGIAPV